MTKQLAGLPKILPCASVHVPSHNFDGQSSISQRQATRWSLSWGKGAVAFVAAVMLAGANGARAQAPTLLPEWSQLSPGTSPPAGYQSALTYDTIHGQAVLFGGVVGGSFTNNTWLWNGSTWSQAASSGPSARSGSAMAFDAIGGNVVLFGGVDASGTAQQDTWLWNGSSWSQVPLSGNPANNPPARFSASMVYDAALGEIVMFGGTSANNVTDLGDTWVWNGSTATWTQVTQSGPSARDSFGMAYDSVNKQVVLFGGYTNTSYSNQTWTFDGTNFWVLKSPPNSPPGRDDLVMAYDPQLGETVMFGGINSQPLSDTWEWNGTNWTNIANGVPSARWDSAMTFDAAQGQLILFSGWNSPLPDDTWTWGTQQNFGGINVCPSGQSTPAPCSNTVSLTYSVSGATYFGTPQVVVQGAAGNDFTLASGSTCVSGAPPVGTCTANVTFTPQAPGLRTGAVKLVDAGNNLLTSTPIYGVGQAPEFVFGPQATGNGPSGLVSVIPGLTNYLYSANGMTTDESGNLYITNYLPSQNSNVLEVAPGGSVTTIGGFVSPGNVAIDGTGNIYVADNGLNGGNGEVVKLAPGCINSSCGSVIYSQPSNGSPNGVAVDGLGDVFVADLKKGVFEIPAGCASSACWISVGSGWYQASAVTVDSSGDLFVAASGSQTVVEMPAGCISNSCQVNIGSGWVSPTSVAVDPAGDLIVADYGLNGGAGGVVEVPADCMPSSCQTPLLNGQPIYSLGATVNSAGEIFIADDQNLVIDQVNTTQTPTETFLPTPWGVLSTDSPQSLTILNAGNQTLSGTGRGIAFPYNTFVQADLNGNPPDCVTNFSLAPGQGCNLSIDFDPVGSGGGAGIGSQIWIYNNSLNGNPALDYINLGGSSTGGGGTTYALTVTEAGSGGGTVTSSGTINCSLAGGSVTGTCSESDASGAVETLSATVNPGSFLVWGGACAPYGTSLTCTVNMSQAQTVSASFLAGSFGSAQVCPGGVGTDCSNTFQVTFNFTGNVTVSQVQAVTQGITGLDFADGSDNCTGNSYSPGDSCTVNVTFTPLAPGLRLGAVQLLDSGNNVLVTQSISGVGEAPVAAFSPLQAFGRYLGGPNGNCGQPGQSACAPLNSPTGVTVNATGASELNDIYYLADTGNSQVLELQGNNTNPVYSGGLGSAPQSVVVDGTGDIYVADDGLGEVVEIPAGCTANYCQNVPYGPYGSGELIGGMAVDGAGDLFFPDATQGWVLEITPSGGFPGTVYEPGGGSQPAGVAVDTAGDVFVADPGISAVVEIPAGCASSSCQITVGSGWSQPQSIAVDAAGDAYVSDTGLSAIVEVPAGCTTPACQITVVSGVTSYGVTVDPLGVVSYVDFNGGGLEQVLQQFYGFGFSQTLVYNTSSDSPKSATLQNVGNQQLTASLNITDPDFIQANLSLPGQCTAASFSLAAGATCNMSINFAPQSGGSLSGNATFTDNALNNTPSSQSFGLSGTGIPGFGADYLTVTETGSGSGTVTSIDGLISCSGTNGTVTGVCLAAYSNDFVYLNATPTGGSIFTGWSGACASYGTSTQCVVDVNAALSVSANFVQGSFGGVNVCAGGNTSGCTGSSQTVTFNFTASTTINSVQVVTQGQSGLDFQYGGSDTCSGNTFSSGQSCTVNVNFTPTAPGLRMGAAELLDGSGNVLETQFVSGIGQGPAAAFGPATQTTVGNGLKQPQGVAVDAAGNIYISDYILGEVFKVTPGGVQTAIPATGLANPYGVAVDGAGDVFIADPNNSQVVKVPYLGNGNYGTQTTVGSVTIPYGVAVDGAGNVYIVDSEFDDVVKVTPSGVQSTVISAGATSNPYFVAVDAAGDVFVSEPGTNPQVVEVTPSGSQTTIPISGLPCPYGVAVDAADDVYVSDPCINQVVEVTPGGVQTTLPINSLSNPINIAVDGGGNLIIGSEIAVPVIEVNSSAPLVSFDTGEYYQSQDSPLTVQNVGNEPLSGTVGSVTGAYIYEDLANSNCNSFTLPPAASCENNYYSDPTSLGLYTGSAQASDNSLNGTPATQTISLIGLSYGPTITLAATGTGSGLVYSNLTGLNCNIAAGVDSGPACSYGFSSGLSVTLYAIPSGVSTFISWGGACASTGTGGPSGGACTLFLTANTNVIANFSSGIANQTLTVTDIGSGSGTVTDSSQITCTETNGINSGACSGSYSSGTGVTLTATPTGTSQFLGWGGACASAGSNSTCIVTMNSSQNVTASFSPQSFGSNINVCPTGQTTPAPCSSTQTVTFNLAATTTIGVIQVVTQGATGLDFSLGSGSTCTGTIAQGNSCNVNVNFAPLAPGLRAGAVELYDNNGNLVATSPIYGIGQGPAAAFGPGAQTTVYSGNPAYVSNSVAVDAAGDLFIAQTEGIATNVGQVVEVAANGTQAIVGSGLEYPQGLAVDGAGNIYVADNNLGEVVKFPAGCTTSACQTTVGSGLSSQLGVAVDGAGDVFIGSYGQSEVVEVPANGGSQTVVYNPVTGTGPASHPIGLAADAAGDLFIADGGLQQVVEVPAGCTTSGCQISIGRNWQLPQSVAVDAAGDIFVSDTTLQQVVEVPAGCISSVCQASCTPGNCAVVVANGIVSLGATVDSAGDIFIANAHASQVAEVTRLLPPSLSFALTNEGGASADSPQSVSLQNVGNQPLSGSVGATSTTSYAENPSPASTCGTFALAPGASCSESFTFTPQSTGILTDAASFSDNTLNFASSVVLQTVKLSGIGSLNGATGTAVPNVVGMAEAAAATSLTDAGLTVGAVSSQYSSSEPAGSVVGQNPIANSQANLGAPVALLISTGEAPAPTPNPLTFENNYFLTGDYATAGVTLRQTGVNGIATGTITIPDLTSCNCSQGVPDGADIIDGFLYWTTLENTATPSGNTGTFLGYPIVGQQTGSDLPYTDGTLSGTLRVYRADVGGYFQTQPNWNGELLGSGPFTVTLPDSGTSGQLPITEGASLVVLYRALSTSVPLKSVIIYDGSVVPPSSTTQTVQGFYDALGTSGTGESTTISYAGGSWNNSLSSATLAAHATQYTTPLNANSAYAAVIFSTPVTNSDSDGILDAWKTGPSSPDFFVGQPGYYDVKTQSWVALPGAKHGEKDLFVQLDYMCGSVLSNGACTGEDLFPSPDVNGNDPLVMVQKAFANTGIVLHLEVGNAVPESTCEDSPGEPCEFPGEPGVIGWKNSLEFTKLWPRNFTSCASGGDCTARFPYGQKDSYHYVLFGHSLAIPAWNSRFGSLVSISAVAGGSTTIVTTNRGAEGSFNYCPSRITISGVLSQPILNGVYNTSSCPDAMTIIVPTPSGITSNWTYTYSTNTPPEPEIGITSGTVTSISGYSDLGGSDSAVTLALWETDPNQDMSKRAQVIAGTLFHEIGHTLGLSHGGLYYQAGAGSYVPSFDINCKPNYQSVMNYLFQLDGVGPNNAVAYSNQTLETLTESTLGNITNLVDTGNNPATYSTSAWYSTVQPSSTASPATSHCDGSPLTGDTGYFIEGSVAPTKPAWSQAADPNISFDGAPPLSLAPLAAGMLGYNDTANIDLRQVGATGGEFASLANLLSFGSSSTPVNVMPGQSASVDPGGTVSVGNGGSITLTGTGTATVGNGAAISSSGAITLATGGSVTLSSTALGPNTITPGTNGIIALPTGGDVTLSNTGTITLPGGGTVTLGGGGNVTLGGGKTGTISAGGVTITVPAVGGSYLVPAGGTVTLGGGGTVTLGGGGNVTLGGGGTVTLGGGGNVTLGGGRTASVGAGGTVTLGGGGNVTLGGGGNVTLGGGGTITLGGGGTVTLGGGGNVTLGGGGTVTLGGGGNLTIGSGGIITLGAGGNVTLGGGGTITLAAGGTVTLGGGGNVTLGGGKTGTVSLGGVTTGTCSGSCTLPAGGTVTLGGGGTVTLGGGGNVTLGGGGTVTLGGGGTVTLGGGGTVTLGGGGNVTLGGAGNITLGGGGNVTLGGGKVSPGGGGANSTEMDYNTANSVVRPPSAPTYSVTSTNSIQVNWTAPIFGVVQTYTISRSVLDSSGNVVSGPTVIGSVSGVGGAAPATTFTDTTPPTPPSGGSLHYTIATTLVPDTTGSTPRSSAPSVPAVLTVNQTIVLGQLPSSVSISTSTLTVTATAESNTMPNGQLVSFSATGPCSVGASSMDPATGISSAVATLNSTGSCTITASQPGDSTTVLTGTAYSAATSASATFTILPQGSTTQSQTITFPTLANVVYGGTFSVSASSSAGLPVSLSASGPCTISGATTGAGLCKITASAPAGTVSGVNYSAASVTQSFAVTAAPLTVTANPATIGYGQSIPPFTSAFGPLVNGDSLTTAVTGTPALSTTATSSSSPGAYPITVSTGSLAAANYAFVFVPGTLTIQTTSPTVSWSMAPPTSAAYGSQFTVQATSNSTGAITYSTSGGCTNSLGVLTMTSGTMSCLVSASVAAAGNYTTGSVGPTSVTATLAAQTITFTTNAPSSAAYGASFTVAATASSGLPVAFTNSGSAGSCRNSGSTYTITGNTGTCSVIANQAGNINYAAAPTVTQNVTASGPVITVTPSSINYGAVKLDSITIKTVTVTNTGNAAATISTPFISLLKAGNRDEFVVVNLCPSTLAAGKSCTITVTFVAGAYYSTPQTAILQVMDNAPGNPQPVALSATVLEPQSITFTTTPPASAVYHTSFTVAATASSGLAVTFTSSGSCSNSGATYTITSGSGTCSVMANQTGNFTWAAAPQVTKSATATLAAQTISFTTTPPSSAAYKSSFTVAATGGASGNAVTFTSSGTCSNSGATYTMTAASGTCSVIASQAGNSNYSAAPQVTKSVAATVAAQTITFTTNPPASAAYKSSFTVAASASSGLAVTYTSSGTCTNSGATYTVTSGSGSCLVIANQAGNSNYSAATKITQTVIAAYSTASLTPASLSFGTVASGKSSTAKTATLSNTGTTPLIIGSIGFTGANPSSFTETTTCPSSSSSLAAGKNCTVSVIFKSSGVAASASLTVTDNIQAGTQSVSLSGN